jgi:hypothetical protein
MSILNFKNLNEYKMSEKTEELKEYEKSEFSDFFEIEEFIELANEEYNTSYGTNEVELDLKLVGEDFWLERWEYDGSEGWEFKTMPKKPNKKVFAPKIFTDYHRKEGIWKQE